RSTASRSTARSSPSSGAPTGTPRSSPRSSRWPPLWAWTWWRKASRRFYRRAPCGRSDARSPRASFSACPARGYADAVTTFEELDKLSSKELHDRAVKRARRHLDVAFFWRLLEETPAAEAADGDLTEAEEQTDHWSRQVMELVGDDHGKLDAQRPI